MHQTDLWTLGDWLAWQSSLTPHRMEFGLERIAVVWSRLGPPTLGAPVIAVGGTNGKGSTVAYLEAIARAAGYHTGCYTSPHLLSYHERVRIDGTPATDRALCAAFSRVEQARGDTPLTVFEFGTLAALVLFVDAGPDLVILEVGLGGRLDAVNLIDADCAVVASIGHDHMALLGESLEAVAREKAGIFRADRPAIIGQRDAPAALRVAAQALGARVLQVGQELGCAAAPDGAGWIWSGADGERLALPIPAMRGSFQQHNAAAAIAALRALRGRLPVPVTAIRAGLARARLPGRFQVFPGAVTWILDVAHNREAAQVLAENLREFRCPGRVRAVFGVLADKEPEAVAAPLRSLVDTWYLTASADDRAMSAQCLGERLHGVLAGVHQELHQTFKAALDAALTASVAGDCLLVFGSFTTVGEALKCRGE
ncbi:bifunctional tetrahydrofolate synthase/dihydrofolate synthase [uncultured Thiodictyon sp.]|uniref:bifunctional tetrahydrofolate synthase/dihydrofolate synthase n=1 Tax=uncultured Thiodictyon sp. TaxID=1846217 RepID=UPI0025E049DD|nr:bifunctional tetrahydrofolate synthase/dihydrofolate synthase [uncultured Thiodictyon sp.]